MTVKVLSPPTLLTVVPARTAFEFVASLMAVSKVQQSTEELFCEGCPYRNTDPETVETQTKPLENQLPAETRHMARR